MRKTQMNDKLYTKVLNAIDKFFNSDFYIATFALCVFLSWFWECEYIAVGVAIISLCYMFLTQQYLDRLIPIAIMICAMVDNNMRHRLSMSKLVVLICLLLVVVGCAVYHFLKVHKKSERKLKSSTLFLGFLTASIAGFLGGIGYEGQTIGLSLMVGGCGLAFLGLYLLLYKCTDDKSKDTVVKSIIALCFIIVAEVMVALIRSGDALALIALKWMSLGWAITNSVASVLAIGIPLCFYMASKHKFQLGYMFSATLFLLFIFLTNCRSMMLAGAVVYCICIVLSFIKLNRWQSLINVAVLIVVGLIAYCTIFDEMFSRFIKYGIDGTGREEIYVTYWQKFKENKVFGIGFYTDYELSVADGMVRAHNTILQVFVSTGIVGAILFIPYFVQRFKTMLTKLSWFKVFVIVSYLAYAVYGLVDCAFISSYKLIIMYLLLFALESDSIYQVDRKKIKKDESLDTSEVDDAAEATKEVLTSNEASIKEVNNTSAKNKKADNKINI